jgi:hypothetical protein
VDALESKYSSQLNLGPVNHESVVQADSASIALPESNNGKSKSVEKKTEEQKEPEKALKSTEAPSLTLHKPKVDCSKSNFKKPETPKVVKANENVKENPASRAESLAKKTEMNRTEVVKGPEIPPRQTSQPPAADAKPVKPEDRPVAPKAAQAPETSKTVEDKNASMKLPIIGLTKRNEAKTSEPPKRMMIDDLAVRPMPQTKNIKMKILAVVTEKHFYLREDKDELDDFFDFVDSQITDYCKDKKGGNYKPV